MNQTMSHRQLFLPWVAWLCLLLTNLSAAQVVEHLVWDSPTNYAQLLLNRRYPLTAHTSGGRQPTFSVSGPAFVQGYSLIATNTGKITVVATLPLTHYTRTREFFGTSAEIRPVGKWPGYSRGNASVTVVGDRAYLHSYGFGPLTVVDVSDPLHPVRLGSFGVSAVHSVGFVPDAPRPAAAVIGSWLYLVDQYGYLSTANVNDGLPRRFLEENPQGTLTELGLQRSLAYRPDGVYVLVDFSTPGDPADFGYVSVRPPGSDLSDPGIPVFLGQHAYAMDWYRGLLVMSFSDPLNPVLEAHLPEFRYEDPLWLSGSNLVARTYQGFTILEVSQPTQPKIVGRYETTNAVTGIQTLGPLVYVGIRRDSGSGAVEIMDISDPSQPVLRGRFELPNPAYHMHIVGPRGYVVTGNYAHEPVLQIIDLTDPAQPRPLGALDLRGDANRLALTDNHLALLADGAAGLKILDVSRPGEPTLIGQFQTTNQCSSLNVVGTRAYVGDGATNVHVLDIGDPRKPLRLGGFTLNPTNNTYAVAGRHAYLADGSAGLRILDLGNPAAPAEVGRFATPRAIEGIRVEGTTALLAVPLTSGLSVDVSDPANPRLLDRQTSRRLQYGWEFGNLVCRDHYFGQPQWFEVHAPVARNLFMESRWDGKAIAEIAGQAVIAGATGFSSDLPFFASTGLKMLNSDDPLRPFYAATLSTADSPRDFAVKDDMLYVAEGLEGLTVYRVITAPQILPETVAFDDSGGLHFRTSSVPGRRCAVLASDDLSAWREAAEFVASGEPVTVSPAAARVAKFFRIVPR